MTPDKFINRPDGCQGVDPDTLACRLTRPAISEQTGSIGIEMRCSDDRGMCPALNPLFKEVVGRRMRVLE